MPVKVSYVTVIPTQQREFEELARKPGWRIIPCDGGYTRHLPAASQTQLDSAVLIASGTR